MPDCNALTDEEFRAEARAFFERHYPQHLRYILRRARWSEMRDWYLTLSQHGWIAPNWPREYGGMGLDAGKMMILLEEQERYGVARVPDHGIVQVGPIIMKYGSDEQKKYYLPKILVRRAYLGAGIFRAQRRLRSREPRHLRDARRHRLHRQRAENLDHAGARRDAHLSAGAHRQAGEKAGRHQLSAGRRQSAGHHDPADPQSRRARGILRGVLRERARAAGQPGRRPQPGLDRRQGAVVVRARQHRQPAPAAVCADSGSSNWRAPKACSTTPVSSTSSPRSGSIWPTWGRSTRAMSRS